MKKTLYVLRHAHVDSKGILLGRTDVPLSGKGQRQAEYWQKALQEVNFQAVWTSPLQRAVQTAEILLEHRNPKLPRISVPAFTEIALGLWDGQSKTWIQETYSQHWLKRGANMDSVAPPEGESFIDLQRRVLPVFFTLCQEARQYPESLMITHQAVNRVILAHVLGIALSDVQSIAQDYACLNILDITDEIKFLSHERCPL